MNNNRPLFIVVEGLDGTGKTTIGEALSKELCAEYIESPDKELKEIRKKSHGFGNFVEQLFYAAGVLHNSIKVEEMLKKEKSIVMARYWPSTIVYDSIVRKSGVEEKFWMENFFSHIRVPDYMVYITIDAVERAERINKRKDSVATDQDSITHQKILHERYNEIFDKYKEKAGKVISVSNDHSAHECVSAIMRKLLSSCSKTP